jgi:hypothetical protein
VTQWQGRGELQMFEINEEAKKKMTEYLKERDIEGFLRVYMAYG